MKHNLLITTICCLCFGQLFAQGTDDFTTLTPNNKYATYTTTAGWVGENCAVLAGGAEDKNPIFKMFGDSDATKALCMNGKTTTVGKITSPILSGGCGTLSFDYGYPFSESKGVSFHVAIMQGDVVTHEFDVINTSLQKFEKERCSEVVNLAGDFQIVMTNNSPSNSTSNKDRFAVWNIAWTECAGGGDQIVVDAPVVTPESGTYASEQMVTITVADGLKAYYTLDSSTPTTSSTLYTQPFSISNTTTLKVVAADASGNLSKVVTRVYTISKEYSSIADMKREATTVKAPVIFSFKDLLVTGVSGKYLYVSDGQDGFLLYGTTSSLQAGDKISGKVSGNLYLYNGLTEMDGHNFDEVTISSQGNPVEPKVVTIADIAVGDGYKTYESLPVKVCGLSFASTELNNKNVTLIDEFDNEIIFRDQFNIWGELNIDLTKTYDITAFVQNYNGTPQLSSLKAADICIVTNLNIPTVQFELDSVIVKGLDANVVNLLTTNSDGAITYNSSNPNVATVSADGQITLVGYGVTTIKAETAETSTYVNAFDQYILLVLSAGDGSSIATAYISSDLDYYNGTVTDKVWICGYMVGYINGASMNTGATFAIPESQETEVLIATTPDETDPLRCVPVQLPKGAIRDALDLFTVQKNYRQQVWVYGNIATYFGCPGVKNVSDYSLNGQTASISSPTHEVEKDNAIYNLLGIRVDNITRPGIYIVGGKKVIVK